MPGCLHAPASSLGIAPQQRPRALIALSPQQRCADTAALLGAAAPAFLDAHLKQRPQARAWPAGDDAAIASGRIAALPRR